MDDNTIKIIIQVGDGGSAVSQLQQVDTLVTQITKNSQNMGKTWGQTFREVENNIRFLGGSMQSLGNVLTKISRPMRRLFSGTVLAAGYKFFNLMSEGISGSAERYDVFATYEKQLSALGYGDQIRKKFTIGNREAMNALDNLEQSVLGLPTGLDEITASMKKYLAASGDVETATKAAIAANNLFLAQGSNARDQLRGERQLRNMLAGGEMTTARWQTVLESMPAAVKAVGDEMGYTNEEFRKMLLEGDVNAKEFLNTLLEVGTSGVIQDAANEMKHTFSAATANIRNAFRRMGAGILSTFDEIFKAAYGKDTIDMIISIKDAINQLSAGIQNWIRSNPEVFINFIDTIKSIDWKGIFLGIGDGIKTLIGYYTEIINIFKRLGNRNVAKFFTLAGFYGKMFTFTGGILKGLRMPLSAIITMLSRIRPFGKEGILGRIAIAITGTGKGASATAIYQAPRVIDSFRGILDSLSGLIAFAGGLLITGGTVTAIVKMVKTVIRDFKEIGEIAEDVDWELVKKIGIITAFVEASGFALGAFVSGLTGMTLSTALQSQVLGGIAFIGAVLTAIIGVVDIDLALIKRSMMHLRDATQYVSEAIDIVNEIKDKHVDSEGVDRVLRDLNKVYMLFQPKGGKPNETDEVGIGGISESMAKQMANKIIAMRDAIKAIKESAEQLVAMSDFPDMESAHANLKDMATRLTQIYVDLEGSGLGVGEAPRKAENISKAVEHLYEVINTMNDAVDKVTELNGKALAMNRLFGEHGFVRRFAKLKELLFEEFGRTIIVDEGYLTVDGKTARKQANDMEKIASIFESFASIFENLEKTIFKMPKMTVKKFEKIFNNATQIIEKLGTWYDEFYRVFTREAFDGADKIAEDLLEVSNVFLNLNEIIKNLIGVSSEENKKFMDEFDYTAFSEKITPFVEGMNGIATSLEGLKPFEVETKVSLMKQALENVGGLIETTETLAGKETSVEGATNTLSALAEAMSAMAEQIGEIASNWNTSIISGLNMDGIYETFAAGITRILEFLSSQDKEFRSKGIKNAKAYIDGVSGTLGSFTVTSTVSVNTNLGSISGLDTLASNLRDTIQSTLSNFTVDTRVNTRGEQMHTGGLVQYRAGGGSIWKSRGTDRIPVMATAGEFMMRKKSVDTFGIDFMKRVNNLDVKGAMQALQSRMAGSIASSKISTVNNIINNYNNQKLTQNVHTNSPSFAHKRSSRYMGA